MLPRSLAPVTLLEIEAIAASKAGFASHQNAVPLLKELKIRNNGPDDVTDLVLELSADPAFVEPRKWVIDLIRAGATCQITDTRVELRGGILADLTEGLTGSLRLDLRSDGRILAGTSAPVEILAKNQWGGGESMAELLPAFCLPNDPAVDRVLKSASEVLRRAGRPDGIDGYERKSRARAWELSSAIWSAVASFEISYALPPASFESSGQKIRTPGILLEGRVATCLDTALLFAAALEQAGLNPLVIITKGHAFAGVWLQPQEFPQLCTDEAAAVRKRLDLQELLVFETTLATQSPAPGFSKAVEAGRRQLTDEAFLFAIDIRRARMRNIRPVSLSSTPPPPPAGSHDPGAAETLEPAPDLPAFDVEIAAEGPTTPAGKLALWQRKLLDLTTRNRLLHIPEKGKHVPLVCPDPGALEDRLAEGKKIRITDIPDLTAGGRDPELYASQNHESLLENYAAESLKRGEVLSTLSKEKLDTELIDLYRKSRSDIHEGGANTLFLAMGILTWRKSPAEARSYRAPLILVPVRLERKSALSGVTMSLHEDEARFNLTLLELLREDFELLIPGLEGPLPTDESGVDIARVWNMVRQAIKDAKGFEVREELLLSTFSFAKYLMWKDLTERREQLMQSPLVRHLLEGRRDDHPPAHSTPGYSFPKASELDVRVDPAGLFTPLPADSSQLAAVVASAEGVSFVLNGPPGTGKSQTIANMIAHNLALGRRVLFVAEKMAALSVVARRLEAVGLGGFCLEVHSSKTSKIEVLQQLDRAWECREHLTEEAWAREAREVLRLRNRLNEIVGILHERKPNGLKLHHCIGRVVRDANASTPRLLWPPGTLHTAEDLREMRETVRRLDLNFGPVSGNLCGFEAIERPDWSNSWQDAIVAAADRLLPALDGLLSARDQLLKATSLAVNADSVAAMEQLAAFARLLVRAGGQDLSFVFGTDAPARIAATKRLVTLVRDYRSGEKELSLPYPPDAVRSMNPAKLSADWAEAGRKFWFLATSAKRKVGENLALLGRVSGTPEVGRDLPVLQRLHGLLAEMDKLSAAVIPAAALQGIQLDSAKTRARLDLAEKLRSALPGMVSSPGQLPAFKESVRRLVVETNELLGDNGFAAGALRSLEEHLTRFREAESLFLAQCGIPSADNDAPMDPATLRGTALAVRNFQGRLKSWCDWRRVRLEALRLRLGPLVEQMESRTLPGGQAMAVFETAYARWFAADVIDSDKRLTDFVSAEHASDIEAYRKLDDDLAKLSVRYIRAKLCGAIPSKQEFTSDKGFAILKHELQKQRRHKPLRQLATEMGDALTRLAPCMLMSPLSIAQYLPPEQGMFDLVIFDEASQITPWDAIGSIGRGTQVVIAGDRRQMPPTNFFNRAAAGSEEGEIEEDLESVLDECLAAGVPEHSLSWHYRSRHESLIAFSNHHYYESKLITFPAAVTRQSAVTWRRVEGVWTSRVNQAEAEALVAETVRRLTDPEFTAYGKSLGIITINLSQQQLVEDLLDKARRQNPGIERYFTDDIPEPVVVKNLESVQGDERDLIMLGIGYGPKTPGSTEMSMNFGPLNRDGGWRRLNVAVTRARQEMMVFSSFDPSMVDLRRTEARAVRDLKHFLEFADRGFQALAGEEQGSLGDYESPLEEAVADGLKSQGWEVVPQIGVSRFRIDLGIVHPDFPGAYLAGVECDGATYHSAATARDRDKVRAAILQGLGWKLLRIWSPDWWVDKHTALARLHADLSRLLENDRQSRASTVADRLFPPSAETPAEPLAEAEEEEEEETATDEDSREGNFPSSGLIGKLLSNHSAGRAEVFERAVYVAADFGEFQHLISPGRFHDADYETTLTELIRHTVKVESPLSTSLLVQRLARAHDFKKVVKLIRERILDIAEKHCHFRKDPLGETFIWASPAAPAGWRQYRVPAASGDEERALEDIPVEEIRAAASACAGADLPREIARLFGIRRISSSARERLLSLPL